MRSSGFGFIRFGGFRTEGLVVDLYTGTTALREVGSDKRVLAWQLMHPGNSIASLKANKAAAVSSKLGLCPKLTSKPPTLAVSMWKLHEEKGLVQKPQ